jgi:hypothetical protein
VARHDPNSPEAKAILRKVLGDKLAGKRLNRDADARLKALDKGAHGKRGGR